MVYFVHMQVKLPDYITVYGIICVVRTALKNAGFGSFAVGFISKKENIHIRIEVQKYFFLK